WLAPLPSSVCTVTRRCGFKTFNSPLPVRKREQRNVRRYRAPRTPTGAPLSSGVGDFQVARAGGFWVAARDHDVFEYRILGAQLGLYPGFRQGGMIAHQRTF